MTTTQPQRRVIVRSDARRVPGPAEEGGLGDLSQDAYGREFLASLMRAQGGVALSTLLPAVALLALYPLLAAIFPSLATAQVFGVPLTLIILGGGIYPPLVLLGFWYVRRSERVERRFTDLLKDR
jgi:hypothetical protein